MKIIEYSDFPVFASRSYLLEKDEQCLLIDCGYLLDEIIDEIKKQKEFLGVIVTHGHYDHIAGLEKLLKVFPNARIYYHQTNEEFFNNAFNNCSMFINKKMKIELNLKTINLQEGLISIGKFDLEIIYTPGHSCDSISIYHQESNNLFVGDFLFPMTVGRQDLPTSSTVDMTASLLKIKKYLTDDITILCGHEESINGKLIRQINRYLKNIF